MNRKTFAVLVIITSLMSLTEAVLAEDWQGNQKAGAVYAMTNAADGNRVVVFDRDQDGYLTLVDSVPTEGLGFGDSLDPLASQGSLVLTQDKQWLLVVNAGSNDVSVFRVEPQGLKLMDVVDSGGEFPVSITVSHNLVYVLNAGEGPNITGFFLSHLGGLIPRPDTTRSLGTGGFAQVGFDPHSNNLVITDRGDNEILVFPMDRHGRLVEEPITTSSNGIAPFGFIFDKKGHLLVSEAGSGAVSSYDILYDGTLHLISPSIENGQRATCWIAGNRRGYVFTANTGSQTLSAYTLENPASSKLTLLDATAGFGNRPIDMGIDNTGRFLYALDPASGSIDMFVIESTGSLTSLGAVAGGFSIFAQGIAVR